MTPAHAVAAMLAFLPSPRISPSATPSTRTSRTVSTRCRRRRPARAPFKLLANQVRLDATIDGRGPFRSILDTGMPVPGIILFQSERVDAPHLADSGQRVGLSGGGSESEPPKPRSRRAQRSRSATSR